jgi:flagellin
MLSVKNNIMAANTARHLGRAYGSLGRSVERLSSGLRVASAKDDAAGMAVRELLRSDIAVLDQAIRNANDGISMLQSSEGALAVIDEIMVRMHTLAEQAATGTYSDAQLDVMQAEFTSLGSEITRIADSTDFNGKNLIGAAGADVDIHLGNGSSVTLTAENLTAEGMGIDGATLNIGSGGDAEAALTALTTAMETKDNRRAAFGYVMNRLEAAVNVLSVQGENLLAAESRISDVDVATEMATLTRNQVLSQAGVSMLAQANQLPQMALQLLG